MAKGVCKNCKKEKEIALSGMAEGLCNPCYRKLIWKPKLIICKRCKRTMKHQAFGLCPGCYNSTFHIEKVRLHNAMYAHGIGPELYKKIIEKCVICGFDKAVDLHHLDHNHKNNAENNAIGLCPNHHKLIHTKKYQKEVFDILGEKGFLIPKSEYSDGFVTKGKK